MTMTSRSSNKMKMGSSLIVSAITLLPLVGAFPGLTSIRFHLFGFLFPSQLLLVGIAAFLAFAYLVISPGAISLSYKHIGTMFCLAYILFLLWGFISASANLYSFTKVLIQGLWLLIPTLYGYCITGIFIKKSADIFSVLFTSVVSLAMFGLFLVLYNIAIYKAAFLVNRLYCPGLGSVISGYTFSFAIAIAYILKKDISGRYKKILSTAVIILLIAVFWTGSRGGVYPALIMTALYFIPESNHAALFLLSLACLILFLTLDPLDYLFSGRMGSIESGRYSTWTSLLDILDNAGIGRKLFGFGLGNIFPYQQWFSNYSDGIILHGNADGAWNHFCFNGVSLLVQPHNSWLWFLAECGLFGLIAMAAIFACMIFKPGVSARSRFAFSLVCFSFIALNCFDSVVFVNMASATWWMLLFLSFSYVLSERTQCNGYFFDK